MDPCLVYCIWLYPHCQCICFRQQPMAARLTLWLICTFTVKADWQGLADKGSCSSPGLQFSHLHFYCDKFVMLTLFSFHWSIHSALSVVLCCPSEGGQMRHNTQAVSFHTGGQCFQRLQVGHQTVLPVPADNNCLVNCLDNWSCMVGVRPGRVRICRLEPGCAMHLGSTMEGTNVLLYREHPQCASHS